jgi:hypothetical protein
LALALGFGVAGLCRSAYQLVTGRLPSFGLLSAGPSPSSFAVVPVSMLAAPFLIMRDTLLGYRQEGRRFEYVSGHAHRRLLEPDVWPSAGDDIAGLRASGTPNHFQFSKFVAMVALIRRWECQFMNSTDKRRNFPARANIGSRRPQC